MIDIIFRDSGNIHSDLENFNYSYHINNFDFATEHSHHDYWEFLIITHGKIENHVNGEKDIQGENTLIVMTTKDYHYIKKLSENIRYINISVYEPCLLRILDAISPTLKDNILNNSRNYSLPESLIEKIEIILHKTNLLNSIQITMSNDLICSAMLLLIQNIFQKYLGSANNNSAFHQTLHKLTLDQNFLTYNVNDLCKKFSYSRAQLNRLFIKHLRTPPSEYLINYKMRQAVNLLKNTDLNVLDIAQRIGYSNLSHFSINFKNTYGLTPGEFRKSKQ